MSEPLLPVDHVWGSTADADVLSGASVDPHHLACSRPPASEYVGMPSLPATVATPIFERFHGAAIQG
jgi:hypothetical protein